MPDIQGIQQKLAKLRESYASSLAERIEQIIADLRVLDTHASHADSVKDIFRQIHSLSGSAGTFGFKRLGEQSHQLELILNDFVNHESIPDARTVEHLIAGLQQLHALIASGPDVHAETGEELGKPIVRHESGRLFYIVDDDCNQGQHLCLHLNQYGFKTRHFSTTHDARLAIEQVKPDALVIDIVMQEGKLAGPDFANDIGQFLEQPVPVLFISSSNNWDSRLAAVRAGGNAYLNKPVEITELVEQLDRMTQRVEREPYRVLIIDDAEELAQHYSLVLRQAGIHTDILLEPSELLEKLESFKPELMLLDFYLPGITGMEIAQVVRQHQTHFSTPIVFLSTETNRSIQLKALQQGDDFLEKPIPNSHLVSAVESRIERSRELSQLMYHDGLTGLLNQLTLKHRLETEMARSQRQGYPLSYIMLDIDYFKRVNDTYGHTTGDQVLKSLAHLLKERLRKTDQIGRYGGEEFGIIMPDTKADVAVQIIDDIRNRFTQLLYQSDGVDFSCSFSAGVACASAFDQEKRLIEAADEALYLSKDRGRNQVTLHKACMD